MHPNIKIALEHLEDANTAGYFEEMDKVEIPKHLRPIYAIHKSKFVQGLQTHDFHQQLEVFAKQINKNIMPIDKPESTTDEDIQHLMILLRENKREDIANLLEGAISNVKQSSSFGIQVHAFISTFEIYVSVSQLAKLNNVADSKDVLLSFVLMLYPHQDNAPEITKVAFLPIGKKTSNDEQKKLNTTNMTGDTVGRDKIERQINMGNGSTYNENQTINKESGGQTHAKQKILFIAAQPDDQTRLKSEFDSVINKTKTSIDKGEIEFLLPIWDVDYEKLITKLKDEKPNVLHYSGHGTKEGLCLINNNDRSTQSIGEDELIDIFENRNNYLKLVLLISCFSSHQAKIISNQGIYVLGINDQEIENDLAVALSERFYLGFTAQEPPLSIEKAIRIGCTNFVTTYPQNNNIISLWKDGVEVDYRTFKPLSK